MLGGITVTKFLNRNWVNNSFEELSREEYFIDKSELIVAMNKLIGTTNKYRCITRPRRFGKSINAMMLASYYSKSADTKNIFDNLKISKSPSYLEHLNKHNVIFITFNDRANLLKTYDEYIGYFEEGLKNDLNEVYPDIKEDRFLVDMLNEVYAKTNQRFIFIIDEWDYIFNNNLYTEEDRKNFLEFLRDLLKDRSYVELAYMTGILPIAKHSSKSTLNMFLEYTALDDQVYDKYFGFTQEEVEELCRKQDKISLEELESWYNGYYTHNGDKIYSPRSVACALSEGVCKSYWVNTGKMDDIVECIQGNVDKIRDDIIKMIEGKFIRMELSGFSSERLELNTREEILSAMVILGFLSYYDGKLSIPNKELRMKFADSLKDKIFGKVAEIVQESNEMLNATLDKDTKTMERILRSAHSKYTSVLKYNDENSIACVITLVYLSALNRYRVMREQESGEGFADFIFYPVNENGVPFLIELKKNKTPEDAIAQIKSRNYMQTLEGYKGEKLLIGITYDTDSKQHDIKIESIQ